MGLVRVFGLCGGLVGEIERDRRKERRGERGTYPGLAVDLGVADGGIVDDEFAGGWREGVLVGVAVEEGVGAGGGCDGGGDGEDEFHFDGWIGLQVDLIRGLVWMVDGGLVFCLACFALD